MAAKANIMRLYTENQNFMWETIKTEILQACKSVMKEKQYIRKAADMDSRRYQTNKRAIQGQAKFCENKEEYKLLNRIVGTATLP